ncbi:MAG: hypothetical protein AB7D37_14755 [Desulfovibrio sp.]
MSSRPLVLIPTLEYLSWPLFERLLPLLDEAAPLVVRFEDPYSLRQPLPPAPIPRLVADRFEDVAAPVRSNRLLGLFALARTVRRTLERLDPVAVAAPSDASFVTATANDWAAARGIPFVVIQPSNIEKQAKPGARARLTALADAALGLPLFLPNRLFGSRHPHNRVLLWGEHFARFYDGLSMHRPVVCGNPLLDALPAGPLAFPAGPKTVLIATEALSGRTRTAGGKNLEQTYAALIRRCPDIRFVVKVHPRSSAEALRHELGQQARDAPNYRVVRDASLTDLLAESHLHLSAFSSTAIEALSAGRPTIRLRLAASPFDESLLEDPAIACATGVAELEGVVRRLLVPRHARQYLARTRPFLLSRIGFDDGQSATRMADHLRRAVSCFPLEAE